MNQTAEQEEAHNILDKASPKLLDAIQDLVWPTVKAERDQAQAKIKRLKKVMVETAQAMVDTVQEVKS